MVVNISQPASRADLPFSGGDPHAGNASPVVTAIILPISLLLRGAFDWVSMLCGKDSVLNLYGNQAISGSC
jgi:hypothetical protein